MKKKLLIIIPAVIAIGVFAGYRYVYKDHRDISSEAAEFNLTVQNLKNDFAKNDSLANAKYADKTIEVSGKITAFDAAAHSVTLDKKLSATLKDSTVKNLQIQKNVKIKGRFVGYDDLLEELKMDQVIIQN